MSKCGPSLVKTMYPAFILYFETLAGFEKFQHILLKIICELLIDKELYLISLCLALS